MEHFHCAARKIAIRHRFGLFSWKCELAPSVFQGYAVYCGVRCGELTSLCQARMKPIKLTLQIIPTREPVRFRPTVTPTMFGSHDPGVGCPPYLKTGRQQRWFLQSLQRFLLCFCTRDAALSDHFQIDYLCCNGSKGTLYRYIGCKIKFPGFSGRC